MTRPAWRPVHVAAKLGLTAFFEIHEKQNTLRKCAFSLHNLEKVILSVIFSKYIQAVTFDQPARTTVRLAHCHRKQPCRTCQVLDEHGSFLAGQCRCQRSKCAALFGQFQFSNGAGVGFPKNLWFPVYLTVKHKLLRFCVKKTKPRTAWTDWISMDIPHCFCRS